MAVINDKIKEIIDLYKADFARIDTEERYKWIAVKHFQDNWDIDAPDFAGMLERAFAKHVNLLDSGVARPLFVIISYAKNEPEAVRRLFQTLYNETLPLDSRFNDFKDRIQLFVDKMRLEDPRWKSAFQDLHAISVYLTFMYPEKYYIYKARVLNAGIETFGVEQTADKIANNTQMCDSIREVAIADEELIEMSRKRLGNNCYQDPNNRMLAFDIAFFTYKLQRDADKEIESNLPIVTDFKKWLENCTHNSGKPYPPPWVKIFLTLINTEAKKLVPTYTSNINLFTYDTSESFAPQREKLLHIIESGEVQIHSAYRKALNLYWWFLKEKISPTPVKNDLSELPITYNHEKSLEKVFLTAENYNSLMDQLTRKKNLILQGAPGVGKTFIAKHLVYSLIGKKTSERICFVQFHQSYGYEDFVMGYRPDGSGFKMQYGVFYNFCKMAERDLDNDWYFIIDEINRGNISKIFGELLMLIESDKRYKAYAIRLPGTEEPFYVPDNVYIIGMMNTADRSIALIDYALRRRFAFCKLEPAFENENFLNYLEEKDSKNLRDVTRQISELNVEIAKDPLLGPGYQIGHSYFVTDDPIDNNLLRNIILYEIEPLLDEYWLDNAEKVKEWTKKLLKAAEQ